jgi:hypothetical protein
MRAPLSSALRLHVNVVVSTEFQHVSTNLSRVSPSLNSASCGVCCFAACLFVSLWESVRPLAHHLTFMHTYTHQHHTCTHTLTHTYTHTYTNQQLNTNTNTHTHTHTHIHTHTHTHSSFSNRLAFTLIAFFVSSSALTKFQSAKKRDLEHNHKEGRKAYSLYLTDIATLCVSVSQSVSACQSVSQSVSQSVHLPFRWSCTQGRCLSCVY